MARKHYVVTGEQFQKIMGEPEEKRDMEEDSGYFKIH